MPQFSHVPVCPSCWAEFASPADTVCACCGDTLEKPASESRLCRVCRTVPPPFLRAVSAGIYQGRMRDAIHSLKYQRIPVLSEPLGLMLATAIDSLRDEAPRQLLVVPIPLHRARLAYRGFNQARVLATAALAALEKMDPAWQLQLAPSTLMRLRATETQAGLTPRQRRLNVKGAFSVSDPATIRDRHILLIDDILTTGATARAASAVLLKAGAASVRVATLARARRQYDAAVELAAEALEATADTANPDGPAAGRSFSDALQTDSSHSGSSHDQRSF